MFESLIGNEDVKTMLRRLRASDRVPNALLLSGDEGVGKRRFALELAKSFLCQVEDLTVVCGECGACRRSSNLNIPDSDKKDDFERVLFSDHADLGCVVPHNKNILVDAIRHLEQEAFFRPFEAPARFFIIDDAHKMNDAAANALLKTLEEPSATSHIFLVTSRPDSLLQTIRSRCQTIRFSPVPAEEIESHLVSTGAFKKADAGLVARLARGSIGRALETDLPRFRSQRETVMKGLEACVPAPDMLTLMRVGEEINEPGNKEFFEEFVEILQTLAHDMWCLTIEGPTDRIVNLDLMDRLTRLARATERARLAQWMEEAEELRASLAVNVNKKVATDALLMKMAGV
jgi:DNA polymerase-3 subunit delta'